MRRSGTNVTHPVTLGANASIILTNRCLEVQENKSFAVTVKTSAHAPLTHYLPGSITALAAHVHGQDDIQDCYGNEDEKNCPPVFLLLHNQP